MSVVLCQQMISSVVNLNSIRNGNLSVAKYLIEDLKIEVEFSEDRNGMTPLHHSCW